MGSETSAALIGAVVGALASWLFSYFHEVNKTNASQLKAFKAFEHFEERRISSRDAELEYDKIESSNLSKLLEEIFPIILENGHPSTLDAFIKYTTYFRHYLEKVEREDYFTANYSEVKMKKIFEEAKTNLSQAGILSIL